MRILLVVPMAPDADGLGAIPKLLHAQLVGLSRDHEVTLVGTFGELPGQAEAAARLAAGDVDAHFADRRRSGSAWRRWRVRLELARDWIRTDRPWRAVSLSGGMQAVLDAVLANRAFDVVSVEDESLGDLRFPEGVPLVLTEHEAGRAQRTRGPGGSGPGGLLRRADWRRWGRFLPRVWAGAGLLQVYSGGDARAVEDVAPELRSRLRVDPFGLALPAVLEQAPGAADTVLFTGTFTHAPNREAACWLAGEIMPAVRARHPRARLRVVGSTPPAEVRDLGGPGVEIVADAPSMAPHLAAAAVVVAPVRSGGGMRLKVLEAMAAGRATVTTGLGSEGFTELGEEPPLAIADGAGEIAAAIAGLLEEPERARELGARAREFAERHYSPEAWAGRLTAVYKEAQALARNN